MRRYIVAICLIVSACTLFWNCNRGPVKWVNPMVGTDLHGHTTPAAILPFGQIQVGPDTRLNGWDGCSGYHYSDDTIYGFSHTHLSGTGCEDLGDVLVMPVDAAETGMEGKGYRSHFCHDRETAEPGYYSVLLDEERIFVELTLNERCAYHRYVYADGTDNGFVIDLDHRDKLRDWKLNYDGKTITGYRVSSAWNPMQKCCFALGTSVPLDRVEMNEEGTRMVCYWPQGTRMAEVYVGISGVDEMYALGHLMDYGFRDFDEVRGYARDLWNDALGKIEVKGGSRQDKAVFYTALYHCMTAPYVWNDAGGTYLGQDGLSHVCDSGRTVYTVFSLWDTYRALHPLMALIDSARTEDWIYTMMKHYEQGGELTMWELCAYETHCMIGYHAVPVILEALEHGILDGWSQERKEYLLEAMLATANMAKYGRIEYARDGYIGSEYDNESVSKTLEYAYDDWCIAQYAHQIGNDSIYREYMFRSQNWRNIQDPEGFMHPRRNGGWLTPFDPAEVNNHYTEANSWQYSSYVPHDIYGWVASLGGPRKAEEFLDSLFFTHKGTSGRNQADITGMIGMYAHGNEPSHHAAYLYTMLGRPEKTQQIVDKICSELYGIGADGLCGNEDCGQMSAWYVMSAMGLYPVCPGSGEYVTVKPRFRKVLIHGDRCEWKITARKWQNGRFVEMMNDGTYRFYNESKLHFPSAYSIVKAPVFSTWNADSDSIEILSDKTVYYTLDGSLPDMNSTRYESAIPTDRDMEIRAVAYDEHSGYSHIVCHKVRKFIQDKTLKYIIPPAPQYSEGGEMLLIDRQEGSVNYKLGGWQGWQSDMEAVITLEKEKYVNRVVVGCLSDQRAWIFLPAQVEVNGQTVNVDAMQDGVRLAVSVPVHKSVRELHVKVKNFGKMPQWHVSAGEQAWLFVDEIAVE